MITPYSKITTIDMWTDPYISKQMLQFHLNKNHDIASRKGSTIENTVNFVSKYIGTTKSICDFGCGPGLYTDLLNQKGHKVIGVDISLSSLEYAIKKNDKVEYINLNYVEDKIKDKVDAAMMIYCDFGALPPKSQAGFLSNIRETLNEDGLFFFDVFSYNRFEKLEEGYSTKEEENGFFMSGKCKITSSLVKYDKLKLSLSYDKAVGNKEIELFNWDKHYDIEEMRILLNDNGFKIVDVYSDTTGSKNFEDNDLLFFVCKKV